MTEKELDKACEWIDTHSGEIWSAREYDEPLDELLADFEKAMTESE